MNIISSEQALLFLTCFLFFSFPFFFSLYLKMHTRPPVQDSIFFQTSIELSSGLLKLKQINIRAHKMTLLGHYHTKDQNENGFYLTDRFHLR